MANIWLNRLLATNLTASLKSNKCVLIGKTRESSKCLVRKSHGYLGYREWNYEPNRPFIQRLMHFNAAIMWCYIYWCFRHNWRELVGEYVWPQRSEWSDQHLGIPPDDYD